MTTNALKKRKILWIAAAAAVCMALIMGTMVIFAQGWSERGVAGPVNPENGQAAAPLDWANTPYRDTQSDEALAKAVCEKYGLDYDTVTQGELTREMFDYETALEAKTKYGEAPLLGASAGGYLDTLESFLDDVFAFNGSRAIIERVCEESGLDPQTAVINDLSIEQLQALQEECYQTSDHPKN